MEKLFGHRLFRVFIPLVDLIIVYVSILLSYNVCSDYLTNFTHNYYAFLAIWPFIGASYLIASRIFELDKPRYFSFFGVAYTVSLVVLVLLSATMAISFLAREFAYPRSVLLMSSIMQILLLSSWHVFTNRMYRKVTKKKTVLVVGYDRSKELAHKLIEKNGMWSQIMYICKPTNSRVYDYIDRCDVTFITEDITEDIKQAIVKYCVQKNKTLLYEPCSAEIFLFNANFVQIDDIPVLDIKELGLQSGNLMLKRTLDILLAGLALLVFAIPFTCIYLSLKIGGGNAFYVQERVTRGGKLFKIYKFRTMVANAEAISGPVLAQDVDKRITKFGHILRATRLDEIPQVFNILQGDMSIVGPRPERPFFVEQFKEQLPEYDLRHRVKAGLTGLAQVQGKYNTTVRNKLKYDLLYINGYSLALDVQLVMQTLNILLRKSSTQGLRTSDELDELIEKLARNSD